MSDDLFDCFGSDDECDDDCDDPTPTKHEHDPLQSTAHSTTKTTTTTRDDESCGVLAFHANTEQSLLMHVKNSQNKHKHDNHNHDYSNNHILPCQHVLNEIDW